MLTPLRISLPAMMKGVAIALMIVSATIAVWVPRALDAAARLIAGGERSGAAALAAARDELRRHRIDPDYLAVVDPQTLTAVERIEGPVLVAVAARVGPARLIDNVLATPDGTGAVPPT